MKKYILVVIVVILALFFFFYGDKTAGKKETERTQEAPKEIIVSMTATGFSPEVITITPHTKVTFKNEDTEGHWPASDPHPIHSIDPTFDPQRPIEPGESWSFVFEEVGNWRFHDHLYATRTGTITVTDEVVGENTPKNEQEANAIAAANEIPVVLDLSSCPQDDKDYSCYENYYKNIVKTRGVAAAFIDLKEEYEQNGFVRAKCHPMTHSIGHAAVLLYPKVGDAYAQGDNFCWSGYYHGVMEGIVGKIGRTGVVSSLNSICADVPGKDSYSFDYFNCVHGLGHGIMAISEDKLPESLRLCDNLVGQWEKDSCYGGAFMENVMVDNRGHAAKYLKPEEPLYPCTMVNTQYKQSCYINHTSYMLTLTNHDFKKVFDLCAEAEQGYAPTCYQSLGRDASGLSLSDPYQTKANCDLGVDYEQKSNCIIGAARDIVTHYHSDVEAKNFCSMLSPDLIDICLETATSYYRAF